MNNLVLELNEKAREIRKDVVNLVYSAKAGHVGGSLSSADIVTTLYYSVMNVNPKDPKNEDRDRFIMSKGHAAELLYCVLADKGYFSKEKLESYSKFGSTLIGHPNNKNAGVEINTGALGHGLSASVGMALGAKRDEKDYRVFTLLGDGELAEGSVWEGAMAAGHYKLDNLCAVVDRNRLQISGNTEDVMADDDLDARFRAFGWNSIHAQGNNIESLNEAFEEAKTCKGKPTVIIADTIKGYGGGEIMENKADWHHKVPTQEMYETISAELLKRRDAANE